MDAITCTKRTNSLDSMTGSRLIFCFFCFPFMTSRCRQHQSAALLSALSLSQSCQCHDAESQPPQHNRQQKNHFSQCMFFHVLILSDTSKHSPDENLIKNERPCLASSEMIPDTVFVCFSQTLFNCLPQQPAAGRHHRNLWKKPLIRLLLLLQPQWLHNGHRGHLRSRRS